MTKKLMTALLIGTMFLIGVTPAFAQKIYPTLAAYEKLTGKGIEAFSEAPMLKVKVAAGEIPPVEERLPDEPMIVEPLEEIGRYGGTIRGPAIAPTTSGGDLATARAQHLFTISPDCKTIMPNIARSWDISKDYKTLMVYLRKGIRWSDGAPFTADDAMFWYEDIILNDELTSVKPKNWSPGGELVKVERIDDYTVRLQFAVPYPPIIDMLAVGNEPFAPKHYLKKWHIKYNLEANEMAKKEGYDEWWMCFNFHNLSGDEQQDVDRPDLTAWALKKVDTFGNKYYERNPYYWKVDTAGNQLPYIDIQARMLVENREVVNLKVIAGEFSYAGQHLTLENYPLFKEGEKKGGYHTLLFEKPWGTELAFAFELAHKDPVLRKIFNDIRWRQAMSLAINREEINDILFFGRAVPRQATAPPNTSFYEDWMGKYYADYDPEGANALLDEMGLKRGKDGYRLRPDGQTLAITIEYCPLAGPRGKICQLVRDYWEKIGIKVAVKEESRTLYQQRGKANERDLGTWQMGGTAEPAMRSERCKRFRPPWSSSGNPLSGVQWWNWYNTGGRTGEEPPKKVKELFEIVDEWLTRLSGTEEYMRLGKEMLTINVKNLYIIGTVGQAPWPLIIKDNLENVPKGGIFGWSYRFWQPYQVDQWFFKK